MCWRAVKRDSFWITLVAMILFFLWSVMGSRVVADDVPPKPSRELLQRVIKGIQANYSQIRSMEVVVEETTITQEGFIKTKPLTKSQMEKELASRGWYVSISIPTKRVATSVVSVDGDNIRIDTVEKITPDNTTHEETEICYEDAWTRYEPSSKRAWRMPRDRQMGEMMADIREWASFGLKESFLELLGRDEVMVAEVMGSGDSPKGAIHIVTKGLVTYEWTFDPTQGFMPIRRIGRHQDQTIRELMNLTYQPVLEKKAWLPLKRTLLFFKPGITSKPSEEGWGQCTTSQVKEIHSLNEPIPQNTFMVKYPEGTIMNDSTKKRRHAE